MHPLQRYRFLEVNVSNVAQQQFFFDTDATLQGAAKIFAVEALSHDYVPKSPVTNKDIVPTAVFYQSFLTLVSKKDDNEIISSIPLTSICRQYNNGIVLPFEIPVINITKCYIRVPNTAGLVANNVWVLAFHYATHDDLIHHQPVHHAVMHR